MTIDHNIYNQLHAVLCGLWLANHIVEFSIDFQDMTYTSGRRSVEWAVAIREPNQSWWTFIKDPSFEDIAEQTLKRFKPASLNLVA